jgi:hypothetical protein
MIRRYNAFHGCPIRSLLAVRLALLIEHEARCICQAIVLTFLHATHTHKVFVTKGNCLPFLQLLHSILIHVLPGETLSSELKVLNLTFFVLSPKVLKLNSRLNV